MSAILFTREHMHLCDEYFVNTAREKGFVSILVQQFLNYVEEQLIIKFAEKYRVISFLLFSGKT